MIAIPLICVLGIGRKYVDWRKELLYLIHVSSALLLRFPPFPYSIFYTTTYFLLLILTSLHFLFEGKAMFEFQEYKRIPFCAAALANCGQQEVWYSCMVSSLSLFEGITLLWAARVLVLNSIDLRYHETNYWQAVK